MFEDRLSNSLVNMGYRKISSNTQGIYLFYLEEEGSLNVVSVIHAERGNEFTKEQYHYILQQVKNNFKATYPVALHLVSLIITGNPDIAKHLILDESEDNHWIIDTREGRVILYETQSSEFAQLRSLLEHLLAEQNGEMLPGGTRPDLWTSIKNNTSRILATFTPVNTSLIIINILIYLIFHYVHVFGGEEHMFFNGALSWYYVKEKHEYYRLITSMFLHSDWDHLFSNMIILLFVGDNLERITGRIRYLLVYFGSGIIAGITSISYNMWNENGIFEFGKSVYSIGASGAIFGVVGAMLFQVIVHRGRFKEISTSRIIIFIILSIYGGIFNSRIDQAAHIGGFVGGLLLMIILYLYMEQSRKSRTSRT
ncbi:rhomboid family intramembrane serine protease [Lachnospiraceae bacterium MD1]|uniref:Rhomboid family intramembrane serine protease n=1 Tax=Variimorphobacter saccharofermentans TaxID=2755051 RepID=A0A839K4Z1_9FIRM|nr:rhomboid family intramembrane serine protease [Variimorphobacter saccharofermentans]MBB2184686.1 rhomboid family intramembrane serine protease [Variimorphobacter saccharofermentans]